MRFVLLLILALQAQAAVGVRLVLGLTDKTGQRWDGSVSAQGARVTGLEPWRFEGNDAIQGVDSWRCANHRIRLFGGGRQAQPPFVANGVIVWLDGESDATVLNVKTAQGDFSLRLADIPYGRQQHALDGRVMADRVPPAARITDSKDEQDYPAAAAARTGEVWVAYLEFRHNPDHDRIRSNFLEPPKDFSDFKAPAGGDQVLVRRFANGAWGPPIAITEPGGDLYRPAITVDGANRPWVFWSANEKGNFDLFARTLDNGRPGRVERLTSEPGSDVFPAATTDARGRVWVAWQAWRDGRASILAAWQTGDAMSKPFVVSSSAGNEWNPAVAAGANGGVAIAWDSYRNGNYDVFARTATAPGKFSREIAIAASARYEAYPSIAYDREGRLWVAYEEGAEGWGKNWGAYDTVGVSLYQGRAVRLVALDPGGRLMETQADLSAVLPGVPVQPVDSPSRQGDSSDWLKPNPDAARNRRPSATPQFPRAPKNTMPRLRADDSGRLWLALRSAQPITWNPVGTVWSEYVASFDGSAWTGPVFLMHSDNLLDNRPALVSTRGGELMVIGSSDNRRRFDLWREAGLNLMVRGLADPYNNDLYASTIALGAARGPAALKAAAPAPRPTTADRDRGIVARSRQFRVKTREGELHVARGEFHRHSEISMDGGNDGTLLDQWRYIIDAAGMDWVGCCDHDNGGAREYSWWTTQKLTDIFYTPGRFAPMFSYERSVSYPEGHRNVVFVERGIRPLPRLPKVANDSTGHAPDTQMFYSYLRAFNGVVASHTSGTNMGTDWRDNDPNLEPVVEIYQGDRQNYEMPGAPRSNSEKDSIGGWRPKGFVNLALAMGRQLAFEASSDHVSTHLSYCNILVPRTTREAVLEGLKKRHVYGATEDILAEVRSGEHLMGDVFTTATAPELRVWLTGTGPFARVHIIKDNKYVYSAEPKTAKVEFAWKDTAAEPGKTSYYYVRGEQEDGNVVWVSPMWITYKP